MDTIVFLGQIYPSGFCVAGRFGRPFTIEEIGKGVSINADIDANSEVRIECSIDRFEDKHFVHYRNKAEIFLNAIVNASAFARGITLTYVLHWLVLPDGRRMLPVALNRTLAALCTSYSIAEPSNERFNDVLMLLARFPRIAIALDEIAGNKSNSFKITVECARAVESLRSELTSTETHNPQDWETFRSALNLERSYIDVVLEHAKKHRHGHRNSKLPAEVNEVLKRSWTIMNRFLEYKLRGDNPLPVAEFPSLT